MIVPDGDMISGPKMIPLATKYIPIVMTIHNKNCVRPTNAMPKIFPIINSNGFTELMMTSTIRLVFSSMTPLNTWLLKRNITKYIITASVRPNIDSSSA